MTTGAALTCLEAGTRYRRPARPFGASRPGDGLIVIRVEGTVSLDCQARREHLETFASLRTARTWSSWSSWTGPGWSRCCQLALSGGPVTTSAVTPSSSRNTSRTRRTSAERRADSARSSRSRNRNAPRSSIVARDALRSASTAVDAAALIVGVPINLMCASWSLMRTTVSDRFIPVSGRACPSRVISLPTSTVSSRHVFRVTRNSIATASRLSRQCSWSSRRYRHPY